MKIKLLVLSAITASLVSISSTVSAAPQILAVMASLGPQQMDCSGSICTTTMSSYCLQKERDVPTTGQAYLPTQGEGFDLVVVHKDGTETVMPASDHVSFNSIRGYSSVRATIGKDILNKLGGVSAKIVVATGATLVPEPVDGDPNPISEKELHFAANSLREKGNEIVDSRPEAEAASIINRIATTLVPSAPANTESLEQLWRDVIDNVGTGRPAGADGTKRARDIYDWCQTRSSYHSMSGIKSCLEFKHDETIMQLNTDYWESQPGL